MGRVAIATATFTKDPQNIRARLAYRTALEAKLHGYPLVVVDGGSPQTFLNGLRKHGALILNENPKGMGSGRRQSLGKAADLIEKDYVVVWMEPEKWPFVRGIAKVTEPILSGAADMVVPRRSAKGLASYPLEQQHAENLGNCAFRYLTRMDLDMWFGPYAVNETALRFFLEYRGEYGDLWDSIFVPRLRAIASGLRVRSVEVDYVHPPEQTQEEEANMDYLMKRIQQLMNLVPMLKTEAEKLGLKAK